MRLVGLKFFADAGLCVVLILQYLTFQQIWSCFESYAVCKYQCLPSFFKLITAFLTVATPDTMSLSLPEV